MADAVLVTGGAGYIGSHTVRQLVAAGHDVVVLDNLSTGHRWAVAPEAKLVVGDAADAVLVSSVIEQNRIGAVVHFAGSVVVPESVADPLKYYRNNVCASRNLIEVCVDRGVGKFIFSPTAAVYGIPEQLPVSEAALPRPINPYGTTKLVIEWILRDCAASSASTGTSPANMFRYVALRYFNVAGASLDGKLGQATAAATHLLKVACEAACGARSKITIFGNDYPTEDGTCIRDNIHVEDLARAYRRIEVSRGWWAFGNFQLRLWSRLQRPGRFGRVATGHRNYASGRVWRAPARGSSGTCRGIFENPADAWLETGL